MSKKINFPTSTIEQEKKEMMEAISKLPGKILGHDESLGIYELSVMCSGGTDVPTVKEAIGRYVHVIERNGTENYMRFSVISYQLKHLMGEVLTTLEASISDERQLKATKSIIKNYFGRKLDWIYELCGTPYEESNSLMDSEE